MPVTNFYSLIPKNQQIKYINKSKYIIHPSQMLISAPTGQGKTNLALNIIETCASFHRVYLFAKKLDEPLYKLLKEKLAKVEAKSKQKLFFATSELDEAKDLLTRVDPRFQNLIIIDDMVTEKKNKLKIVEELYSRCRKDNCSIIFLSQSYYETPKFIRDNCRYIFLSGMRSSRNLKLILKEYGGDDSKEMLAKVYNAYKQATNDKLSFFMIDMTPGSDMKYRRNLTDVIPVEE